MCGQVQTKQLCRKDLRVLADNSNQSQQSALEAKKCQLHPGLNQQERSQKPGRRDPSPLFSTCETTFLSAVSHFVSPITRQTQAYWNEVLQRDTEMVSWMEHVAYEERTRAVFVQPGEKRQRRDHIAICNYIVGGHRGDGASCFLPRHKARTRGNKQTSEHGKFSLNIRNKSFHKEGGLILAQGSREVVEPLSLELLKTTV